MPINLTDTSTFTDPVVVPADADPLDRTYVVTAAQALANRTRYLKDERDTVHSYVRPDLAASGGTYLHAIQGTAGWDGIDNMPGWTQGILGAGSQGSGKAPFTWSLMGGGNLPQEVTITSVRVYLKGGVSRPTSTDRMRVRVYGLLPTMATSLLGDERDNGGTTLNAVAITGLSALLNNGLSTVYGAPYFGLLIQVDPGVTAGTDGIYFAEVRYTTSIR